MFFSQLFHKNSRQRIISLPDNFETAKNKKISKEFKDVYTHDWQKIMTDQMRIKNDVDKINHEIFSFDPSK